VARILINMKSAEAAKIMAYLGDDQVEGILRSMGVRQAAMILAQLPVERAAKLSRRLMAPAPAGAP
jgi:flagellar motility protein MotE (MotC chaperone)